MRKFMVVFVMAAVVGGCPATALEIIVTNADAAKVNKVTISDPENDVERGFEEDDGAFVFETDDAWMGGRGIVEAVIDPDREDDPLHLTASLYTCVAPSDCTIREIVLPEFPEFFAYRVVPAHCGSQAVTNNFNERLEKYLYCRAAYRWFEARNLADAENWPASSFALWGWFRAAYELHTLHRYRNAVPFISWDKEVQSVMETKLASDESDVFLKTIAIRRSDIETDIRATDSTFMAALSYAKILADKGARDQAAQVVRRVSDKYSDSRTASPAIPIRPDDLRFLNTLRTELDVGEPFE